MRYDSIYFRIDVNKNNIILAGDIENTGFIISCDESVREELDACGLIEPFEKKYPEFKRNPLVYLGILGFEIKTCMSGYSDKDIEVWLIVAQRAVEDNNGLI